MSRPHDDTGVLEGPERLLGTVILDFQLKEVLGAGGMSVVYKGEHRLTGQEVAIKILPPELAVHEDLKARFVEEARVLAKLEHANIVGLNNFVESGGRLCLVMTFVPGKTFEKMIEEGGKAGLEETLRVGIEVCKALEYAHEHNVIHRDIKPSNVLVRDDGAVKVTDFGIAKMLGNTRLTSTGQTMGTVRYMSPEQVRGHALDARSDLYSLGITLWEAITGRCPFEGENQFEIMQQHISKLPPMFSTLDIDAPAVEKVLRCAMEKDPNDRFPDAKTFREQLEHLRDGAKPLPVPLSTQARSRRTLALALGAAVLVAGGVGLAIRALRPPVVTPTVAKKPAPSNDAWPAPHAVTGLTLAVDQIFEADRLRVQSAEKRDPEALRARYRAMLEALKLFLGESPLPAARAMAKALVAPPLTVALVPQSILNNAGLWPGFHVQADKTYPSRYVEPRRTLFVAAGSDYEAHDLAYGVALHVLVPNRALSNDECMDLAEGFEAYYAKNGLKPEHKVEP